MKVALLGTRGIPPRYGGTETYVEKLSSYLASRGDNVVVYCQRLPTNGAKSRTNYVHAENIKRIEVPSIPTKHLDNVVRTLLSTFHVCLDRGTDVVQFNNVGPGIFCFLPRLFGKKVVVAVRAVDSRRAKWSPLVAAFLQVCERLSIIVPHLTTVNALSVKKYYRNKYGADTVYIPNGVDIPASKLEPNKIAEWGLRTRDYILFCARLEPEKRCHVLIEGFKRFMAQTRTSLKLAIAGHKGHSKAYVKELEKEASDRIRFLDYVSGEALEELYSNAFAFVLPSSVEGMSNALLSAMAYALPVVVSDIPENLEVIEEAPYDESLEDRPGLSFRLDNPEDLANKLTLLAQDPAAASRRGALLRSHIRAHFSLEEMGRYTREAYETLLAG